MTVPAASKSRPLPGIDHGSNRDIQRSRELYKYYQPPLPGVQIPTSLASLPASDVFSSKAAGLLSSPDPALSSFALLTANLLSCKRSMISLIDQEMIYIIAESTRSLSVTAPHTCEPGDELWLGGCMSIPRGGGLCERTVSLLAPDEIINGQSEDGLLIFEVPDLTVEPAYMHEDYVNNYPYMHYYAGVPLRTKNGYSIGSLCVIDDHVRPEGLRQQDKLTLAKMAETVMGHLERVRAERDMVRGRNMEFGISSFLAENFRSGRGDLDDEVNGGKRPSHEDKKQERRSLQAERLKWVDEVVRQDQQNLGGEAIGGEIKTAKISIQGTNGWNRRKESDPFARDFATDLSRGFSTSEDIWPESSNIGLTKVKTSQLPLSFPSLQPDGFLSGIQSPHYPAPMNVPNLSRKCSSSSIKSAISITGAKGPGSTTSGSSLSATIPPSSPADSLFRGSDSFAHCSAATTPTGQLQTPPPDANSSFRSTFARASVLIRKSIEADGVVFLDADLEDTYNDDCIEGPEATLAAPLLDIGLESKQRPKKYRRRSGILGFATKSGSSCLNPFNSDSMLCRRGSELERSLGFDIGEIDEAFLHSMADRWPQGCIFSCAQYKRGGASHDPDSDDPDSLYRGKKVETLKRFLPGAKNIVCMPLYDFSGKLFAVGFAWSCSKTRIFCEDVERNYMAAFGNSIMAEVGRLHCVSADKAKGDFISSVSHELRSPLHGILASAEFLADTKLDSFQRSFVDTVESCGRTLLDTINHVLDFSKLNSFGNKWAGARSSKRESIVRMMERQRRRSDSLDSEESPKSDDDELERKNSAVESLSTPVNDVVHLTAETDLSAILEEVTEGVFAGYEFRGISTPGIMEVVGTPKLGTNGKPVVGVKNDITVIIDIDKREDGWVFETQPGALRRILLNLGGNAIKYTDSGWVRIRMKAEDLPEGEDEDGGKSLVTLIFTDSGKGISREFLKTRLFTPFSQENPLVSGTGLGMSIVRQIVEMLGGEIAVKSQPGKGTEVTVSLVLKRGTKAKTAQQPGEIDEEDAETVGFRQRMKGKRVALCGFETMPPESGVQMRAMSYLRNSFERYLTKCFGMEIVSHSLSTADSDKVDFVITHEGAVVNAHLACTKANSKQPGEAGGAPLIVICSNAARHEIYQPLDPLENKGIVNFVSKPCGPRKLAKALLSCLNQMEAAASLMATKPTRIGVHATQQTHSRGDEKLKISEYAIATTPTTSIPPYAKKASPDANITVTVTQSQLAVEDKDPIARWKEEVERITSLGVIEGNKKLPSTLIVEDNPVNLMLLATFLKKKGYPFEKATNGLEAFQAVEKRPGGFDVILMDLQMPVMSGIESTRAIRRLERQRRRKGSLIIALTGLATANDQLEAFEGGIDLFMVKPVSFKRLEKTLQEFKLEDQV